MLLVGAFSISAQDKWVADDSEWYYNLFTVFNGPLGYIHINNSRDTIVESQASKVSDISYNLPFPFQTELPKEIITKEVGDTLLYFVRGQFHPLYDFSLEIGDTMKIKVTEDLTSNDDSIAYFIVDSLRTTQINGRTFRAQYLEPLFIGAIAYAVTFAGWRIEGIGNLRTFLPYYDLICDHYCPLSLRCYSDSETDYKRVNFECDAIIMNSNTENPKHQLEEINIFPNPASVGELIQIEIGEMFREDGFKLQIFDNRGNMVGSEVTTYKDLITLEHHFPSGIYYLRIQAEDKVITKKFVVLK